MRETGLSVRQALRVVKRAGVRRLPKVGWEVSLGEGRWLSSTGHAQFGWFASRAKTPFVLREPDEYDIEHRRYLQELRERKLPA